MEKLQRTLVGGSRRLREHMSPHKGECWSAGESTPDSGGVGIRRQDGKVVGFWVG